MEKTHLLLLLRAFHSADSDSHRDVDAAASKSSSESDFMFVAKLTILSFSGGAVIKYGSLLSPIPFSADATLAALLVAGPPLAYGAMLLLSSNRNRSS